MTSKRMVARAAVTVLLGLAGLGAAQAQETVLKFSHFLPPNSNFQKNFLEPWCEKIGKESAGKLKCQIYPALQLGGTPAQLADQVKNGVSDIVWTSPSYSTGRFPRTEALELPFTLPPGGMAGSRAMWEFYEKYGKDDFKDFKVLTVFSASNVVLSTASKPILSTADFKGIKLRSPSRFAALFLTALGGTPVNMPVAQVTEGVSKGVIDGAMAPWEVLPSTKIDEVVKYHMEGQANQPGFTQTPMAVLMNTKKFDSLPPDLKSVIDKNSGLFMAEWLGRIWDEGNDAARKSLAARGNKVLTIKNEDYAAIKKATASVEEDWIKQATAKGLDGKKLAAEAHAIGAKYMPK
ncbi:MAG: TRAP transporter substrate-binding protein [Proteobacteria bacterium]|nr:TRAP transporter substrate-binding protein [Burkholderiales bacterium]MCA0311749.1 TRAP transporter substrate-binding protein [Pseudomonadota bacterium]